MMNSERNADNDAKGEPDGEEDERIAPQAPAPGDECITNRLAIACALAAPAR